MEEKNRNSYQAMAFIAGALIGAGFALLFAPQSGRKTRRDIQHLAKVAKNRAEALRLRVSHVIDDSLEEMAENLQDRLSRGQEWTEQKRQEIRTALDRGKSSIQEKVGNILGS